MNHPMRICMVLARYYPCEAGAEIQCRRLSASLVRTGANVVILTQRLPGTAAQESIDGITVYRRGLPFGGRFGSLCFVIAGLFWLWRRRSSFDVLHAHLASAPAVLAVSASLLLGTPALIKFAGSRATGDIATSRATWQGKRKLAFLKRCATAFVCPSREVEHELITAGFPAERVFRIANGIPLDQFYPASAAEKTALRKSLGIDPQCVMILACMRLEPGKGSDVLLASWNQLMQVPIGEHLHLAVLGNGVLYDTCITRARGIKNVSFPGWVRDPRAWYRAADLFVLPSTGEGMPNALLEALACGLPVVATAIGGITELITDGVEGSLIPPNDPAALTDRMTRFAADAHLRASCGERARHCAEQTFAIDRIAQHYLTLYQVLKDRHPFTGTHRT
jgi:glycosyltransferase involved in cell wall biosynthesis